MTRWGLSLAAALVLLTGSPALAAFPFDLPGAAGADPEPGSDLPSSQLASAARVEIRSGRYELAITHLLDALEKSPGDPDLQSLLAEAKSKGADKYVQTGKKLLAARKYDDARVAFKNALDLMPNHPMAIKGLYIADKWPDAEQLVKVARKALNDGDVDAAYVYYGKAYELTKDKGIGKWLAHAKKMRTKLGMSDPLTPASPTPAPRKGREIRTGGETSEMVDGGPGSTAGNQGAGRSFGTSAGSSGSSSAEAPKAPARNIRDRVKNKLEQAKQPDAPDDVTAP